MASRLHSENIFSIIKATLNDANLKLKNIDAIAVTIGPGLVNTLQVGLVVGKTLSQSLNIPLYGINHMEGHLYSPFIDKKESRIPKKSLVLLVSGGHTIIAIKDNSKIIIKGETLDDSIGEAYDKVAKILELGFPGGPAIDKIFRTSQAKPSYVPVPKVAGYDFSYSGIKSFISNQKNEQDKYSLAKGFQISAIKHLIDKLVLLQKKSKINELIIGGGVSANSHLRDVLEKLNFKVYMPKLIYSVDNAAMIGYSAYVLIKSELIKPIKLSEDVYPKMKLGNR